MITTDMTVGSVIKKYPAAREIFVRYGICDCCGGENTIKKAAEAHNANLDALLKQLNKKIGEL